MTRLQITLVGVVAISLLGITAGWAASKREAEPEQKNMQLVGFDDLQARSAY
jgi:hypothetical protein